MRSGSTPRAALDATPYRCVRGAEGRCEVTDFPSPGQTVTLEWQQNSQNFVITGVE